MESYLKSIKAKLMDEFNGNVIPIPLVKGEKRPMYAHVDKTNEDLWNKWEKQGFTSVVQSNADLGLLIRNRAIVVVDFDDKDQAAIFEEGIPEFQTTVKQSTKKGFHYFFKGTDTTKGMNMSNQVRPFGDTADIDIITTWDKGTGGIITIYPSDNKQWINDIISTDMKDMPQQFIDVYNEKANKKPTKRASADSGDEDNTNNANKVDFEILKEIVMNLDSSRSHNYGDWTTVVWGIFNVSRWSGYKKKGNNLIHEFSQLSTKYDEDEVEDFIDKTREQNGGVGIGTLLQMLKEDNEIMFHSVQSKLNPIKPVELNGYSFLEEEEQPIDLRDGQKRDYETMKHIFEATNFKVSGRSVNYVQIRKVNNELIIRERSRKDAIEEYENLHCYRIDEEGTLKKEEFFKLWIKDPKIKAYEEIDFLPPPRYVSPSTFNTWKGFRAEKIALQLTKEQRAELMQPIHKHLEIICNHHPQSVKYVKKWIAQLLQQPGKMIGTALCFQSKEGTGKGSLVCDFLGKLIIGDIYYWESSNCVDDLFNKHSTAFHQRLLVNIDEPKANDLRQYSDRFKSLITNSTQRLENKGRDIRQVTTSARYVITTNNEDVLKLSSNDRRFVVIECSDDVIDNKEYFDFLHDYIRREDVQRAFYDEMMEEDIENFNWKQERPITDAYIQNLDSCVPPHIRFMAGEVRMCESMSVANQQYSGVELFKKFNKVLTSSRSKYSCEYPTFTKWICKLGGVMKKRNMYGVYFDIDVQALKHHLVTKERFNFNHYQFYEDSDEDL